MKKGNQFKIFVVDDDLFYANLVKKLLEDLGNKEINIFDNGVDCLNQLHEKPEVIFLDYNMEVFTGYEVLKKIKRYNPNIYIVMVSAQEEIKIAVEALKHGAFDYIQKGEEEDQRIKSVIQRIIEVKNLLGSKKSSILKKMFQFL